MSQLTEFEKHINTQYSGANLSIFERIHWQCQLVVMETNHPKEFELFIDEVANKQDESFLSDYFKSRVRLKRVFDNRSDSLLIAAYKDLVKETLDNISDRVSEPSRDYKFYPDNSDKRDGSYEAKQAREMAL
jgi:hypothetical protein